MYIYETTTYYVGTEQRTRQQYFLILMQPIDYYTDAPFKAAVRKVSLRQCGQFMMGVARMGGESITLSGPYGGDGLPVRVPWVVYSKYGLFLPAELFGAWPIFGGWNSAGSEAPGMREWARKNLEALRGKTP